MRRVRGGDFPRYGTKTLASKETSYKSSTKNRALEFSIAQE